MAKRVLKEEHEKMWKGVTLSKEEMQKLK